MQINVFYVKKITFRFKDIFRFFVFDESKNVKIFDFGTLEAALPIFSLEY